MTHFSHPSCRKILYLLAKLSYKSARLSSSIFLDGVAIIDGPCRGGYAYVYQGMYQGMSVAIKQPLGHANSFSVSIHSFNFVVCFNAHEIIAIEPRGSALASAGPSLHTTFHWPHLSDYLSFDPFVPRVTMDEERMSSRVYALSQLPACTGCATYGKHCSYA
jgi:hypothetical protein